MEVRSLRESTYPKHTKCFRFTELILCFICLILVIFFWTSITIVAVIGGIIFAIPFSFSIITLVAVLGGMSRNQYAIPAWIGIAFLASYMFFLGFGFLLFTTFLAAIILYLITAIVFIIDGFLLIRKLCELYSVQRIHPIKDRYRDKTYNQNAVDEYVQTDNGNYVTEEIEQARTYAPRLTAPSKKPSYGQSFPITTYGGTFPVGGRDAAPLPTPDYLTGLEPTRPSQLHETKKCNRDVCPGRCAYATEDAWTQKSSIYEEGALYPPLEEQMVEKRTYTEGTKPQTIEMFNQTEASSTGREVELSTTLQRESGRREMSQEVTEYRRVEEDVPRDDWPCNPEDMQGRTVKPCQATGEPSLQQPLGVLTAGYRAPEYQEKNCTSQFCQCCNKNHPARDQVTPFVSHHYDQSPCICGYTHYQASTVIRGAVRQYPQETVYEQQKTIQQQLEQTRQVYGPHVCACHERPLATTKLEQTRMDSQNSSLMENNEPAIYGSKKLENSQLDSVCGLHITDDYPASNMNDDSTNQLGGERSTFVEDDDLSLRADGGKRVTIAEAPSPSSQESAALEYESYLKRVRRNTDQSSRRPRDDLKKTTQEYSTSEEDRSTPGKTYAQRESFTSNGDSSVLNLFKQIRPSLYTEEGAADCSKKHRISPSLVATREKRISRLMQDDKVLQSSSPPDSENSDNYSPRKKNVIPCLRRCWESPEKETIVKSLYWEEGPCGSMNTIRNTKNLRSWETEITMTTTVMTTNFGKDVDDSINVCTRTADSGCIPLLSPVPALDIDSSPDNRSSISSDTTKQNKTNLLSSVRSPRTSIDSSKRKKSWTLEGDQENMCITPRSLPPLNNEEYSQQRNVEEKREFKEQQASIPSPQFARISVDELELRKRPILKNRKEIDEEIRAELRLNEQKPNMRRTSSKQVEDIRLHSPEVRDAKTTVNCKEDSERRVDDRKTTLQQIEELVEQENAEDVERATKERQNVQNCSGRERRGEKIEGGKTEEKKYCEHLCEIAVADENRTSKCICKCVCRNAPTPAFRGCQRNKPFDANKYNFTSLNELPYHPRDDYKLANRRFEGSPDDRPSSHANTNDTDFFWENPNAGSHTSKISDGFRTPNQIGRTEEDSPRKETTKYFGESRNRTLGNTSPSSKAPTGSHQVPERPGRKDRESSSVPKRGSVKRLHPDRN